MPKSYTFINIWIQFEVARYSSSDMSGETQDNNIQVYVHIYILLQHTGTLNVQQYTGNKYHWVLI